MADGDLTMSLITVLEEARRFGFFGPAPVDTQYEHAMGFVEVVGRLEAGNTLVDLGSGGGVPALVIAVEWPDANVVMVESMQRRADFLRGAVHRLGLRRAVVLEERAEDVGRSDLRGTADVVTARGFGPPAMTAECGLPLLQPGGRLVVSEPPEANDRWPEDGLATLGASPGPVVRAAGAGFRVITAQTPCSDLYPRPSGRPRKRPLF